MSIRYWILVFFIGVAVSFAREYENFRLPGDIIPNHYKIKILTDLSDDFYYNGEVCIDFMVTAPTKKIILHSKNLKIFENETKVEEYGKLMTSSSYKLVRRPKEVSWSRIEFRSRPEAELEDPLPIEEQNTNSQRILADENLKPDIVFDRHEIFEKLRDELESVQEEEEPEAELKYEKISTTYNKKPATVTLIEHEKDATSSPKEDVKISSTKGTEFEVSKPSLASVSVENSLYTTERTTMDDRIHFITSSEETFESKFKPQVGSQHKPEGVGHQHESTYKPQSTGHPHDSTFKPQTVGHQHETTYKPQTVGHQHETTYKPQTVGHQHETTYKPQTVGHQHETTFKPQTVEHQHETTYKPQTVGHQYESTYKPQTTRHPHDSTFKPQTVEHQHETTHKPQTVGHSHETTYKPQTTGHTHESTFKPQTVEYEHESPQKPQTVGHPHQSTLRPQTVGHQHETTFKPQTVKYPHDSTFNPPTVEHPHESTFKPQTVGHQHESTLRPQTVGHQHETTFKPQHQQETTFKPQRVKPQTEESHQEGTTQSHTGGSQHESMVHFEDTEVTANKQPVTEAVTQMSTHQQSSEVPHVETEHASTTTEYTGTGSPQPVVHETPAVGFHQPATDPATENYSVLKHEFDLENNFLVVHLDKPLETGKKYTIYLNYQGVLADTLTGYHRVPYTKRGSQQTTWLATTVFEPNEARTAFPCFDEPNLKATFDVTLGHDKKYTALSNMPLKSKSSIEGRSDWQWSEFETTPKMSTYILAFLVSDLSYLTPRINYTENGPNVTYRFWSRSDVLYRTRYAMRIAPEMKNYLENLLEVKDVLPKHDFVALPSFISSALENWGLYSFAEKNLLFTSGFSSIFSKYEITNTVAHELAHIWFGNMVTPKWWDQIWLSEGFSNFFEILAADHIQPTWDLKTVSIIFSYLKVFTFDALHSSHPLVPKLKSTNELNEIFDSITYQKGFFIVRMLNYTLGQETFLNGVRKYLKDNLFSNVDEDNLWEALTECGHQDNTLPAEYHLKDIMHSWTKKSGYPIVEVVRDYENNTATVTQRRFLRSKNDYEFRDNSQISESEETKWYIPLTYTTGSELNFKDFKPRVWLNPQEDYKILTDMPSRNDFVIMNLDVAGLYRVKYDERNWALIISYLVNENSSDISVINRVQILDDLLDLARAGEISYDRALEATSYLTKERHFLPWKAALSNFDFITRMLRYTDSNKSIKKFVRNLVAPRFEELGFKSVRNESFSDALNRKQIVKWACRTGLRQCTRMSISLFKKWTEEKKPDEHNPIPSNLRSIVYCAAIENGGSKDWQFLWQRYLSNVVTDKTAILYGLGCSKSTRTLRKYLDWSIKESSGIRKQDVPTVFKAVVRNDVGFNLAKNFLRDRMGDIKTYLGNNPFYFPQMIETVAAKMNRPSDLKELRELEEAHFSHLRSAPRSFRQAQERVLFNINWVEKNYRSIHDWLRRRKL